MIVLNNQPNETKMKEMHPYIEMFHKEIDAYCTYKEWAEDTNDAFLERAFEEIMEVGMFMNPLEVLVTKWNTRKPMERIVERLKGKIHHLHNVNWNEAIECAIEIVRNCGNEQHETTEKANQSRERAAIQKEIRPEKVDGIV